MDKQQFATLTIGIKSAYPASKILEDNASMDLWYMMLKDIPYDIAENAVMEHICTNVFPPNIAEIRKLCVERCKKPVLSYGEAWESVQKAISTYGRDRPQEAYESMDDVTVSVVKNLGWVNICLSENHDATRANFRTIYEELAKTKVEQSSLPEFVSRRKQIIQEQYIQIEKKEPVQRIETQNAAVDIRNNITPEQAEKRSRQMDEMRRRVFGGET